MGMKKVDIITELSTLGIDYDPKAGYHALRALLKKVKQAKPYSVKDNLQALQDAGYVSPAEILAGQKTNIIKFESRIRKRRVFMGDAMRDERDKDVLNAELRKRIYKGKVKEVRTRKVYGVVDGFWLTEFEIELK